MPVRDFGPSSGETKGVLLALAVLDAGECACAVLAGSARQAIFDAWHALARLTAEEREGLLARWRGEVASGLELLHPSWIEEALAGEPAHLVERLRTPDPTQSPAWAVCDADLAHLAFDGLAPLCGSALGPLAARLCALSFDDLVGEVRRWGARTLGRSLAGSDAGVRSRAMALAGPPWAALIGQAVCEAVSDEERQAATAQVAGPVNTTAHTSSDRLLHIGLRALRAALAEEHPGAVAQVAGRLPAPLGRVLLGPSWSW